MRVLILPAILALAACQQPRVQLVLPPVSLTTCAAEPLAPDLPSREEQARRDALTLDYILTLRSAWGDCKSRVQGLAAWLEAARQ